MTFEKLETFYAYIGALETVTQPEIHINAQKALYDAHIQQGFIDYRRLIDEVIEEVFDYIRHIDNDRLLSEFFELLFKKIARSQKDVSYIPPSDWPNRYAKLFQTMVTDYTEESMKAGYAAFIAQAQRQAQALEQRLIELLQALKQRLTVPVKEALDLTERVLIIRLLQEVGKFPHYDTKQDAGSQKQFMEFVGALLGEPYENIKKRFYKVEAILKHQDLTPSNVRNRLRNLQKVRLIFQNIQQERIPLLLEKVLSKLQKLQK